MSRWSIIRHLRKAGGVQALYRGGGSIAIGALARSVLLVAPDPENDGGRVLASVKGNLGPMPPSLRWRFGEGTPPRVEWLGESAWSANQLVNVAIETSEDRSLQDEATQLLSTLLNEGGGQVLVAVAKKEARSAGISDRTLERAKARLRLRAERRQFAGGYFWIGREGMLATRGSAASMREEAAREPANASE